MEDTAGLCHGSGDENLLLRIAYLVAENRILRTQIQGRIYLSDAGVPLSALPGMQGTQGGVSNRNKMMYQGCGFLENVLLAHDL